MLVPTSILSLIPRESQYPLGLSFLIPFPWGSSAVLQQPFLMVHSPLKGTAASSATSTSQAQLPCPPSCPCMSDLTSKRHLKLLVPMTQNPDTAELYIGLKPASSTLLLHQSQATHSHLYYPGFGINRLLTFLPERSLPLTYIHTPGWLLSWLYPERPMQDMTSDERLH